jgi:uncharacterized hydrophobic protein (TIGR00271 family)
MGNRDHMGIGDILHGGPTNAEDIKRIRSVLLFDEPERSKKVIRFASLLVLASAIATYGLVGDSVATVIGAMIVAPLMLPIMGLAFGISIGDHRAIISSIIIALCGIAAAILVGLVLSLPVTRVFDPEANSQIISRTSPKLLDLLAALATGLAGAFATSRKDVSDTLPGVAIAISLVPPLANVGILVSLRRYDLAAGSMLLFMTNYFAIVLTGSFMFALMGFPKLVLASQSPAGRRRTISVVVLLALIITVPLGATSYQSLQDRIIEQRIKSAADNWVAGTEYRVVSTNVKPQLRIVIAGKGEKPDQAVFQQMVEGQLFGRDINVDYVPEEVVTVSTK